MVSREAVLKEFSRAVVSPNATVCAPPNGRAERDTRLLEVDIRIEGKLDTDEEGEERFVLAGEDVAELGELLES